MRMASIDKKQIKRIRVETEDGSAGGDCLLIFNLWNATGTVPPEPVPLKVLFYSMPISSAPGVSMYSGSLQMERGNDAGVNITNNTELLFLPDPVTGMVVFSLAADGETYAFTAKSGNATYVGSIYTGPRRRPPFPPFPPPWPRPRPPRPRPLPLPM